MEITMFERTPAFGIALAVAMLTGATASLTACAAAAGGSRADRIAAKMKDRFDTADADHDGYVSRAEAQQGLPRIAEHFEEIDANRDGKLSYDEIAQYLRSKRGSR
jgi:hypothetical protein